MVLSLEENRSLLFARLGLLLGFGLFFVYSGVTIGYTVILIFTRGDPEPEAGIFYPMQGLMLSLDIVAAALLCIGFWGFARYHDTIKNQAQNMAIGWGVWTLLTLTWRLRLLVTPSEEVNPMSRRLTEGEYSMFIPHFEFLRVNYLGFFLSATLMFILMLMMVRLIKNYRVYENFQSVNLNLFQNYGLLHMVGAFLLGLGWLSFGPSASGTTLGDLFLVIYVIAWLTFFLVLPILGLWVFFPAFTIHRSAVDTLKFILLRKSERDRAIERGEGEGTTPE